mgnify:FL=1|jgi:hypothetical protein
MRETPSYLHFSDCNTKREFRQCFETYSTYSPREYVTLALRKLGSINPFIHQDDVLGPDQKELLLLILDDPSWESYCDSLSVSQIKCVGW